MLILALEGFFGADGFWSVLKFYPEGVGSRYWDQRLTLKEH